MIEVDRRYAVRFDELTRESSGWCGDQIALHAPAAPKDLMVLGGYLADMEQQFIQLNVHILPQVITTYRDDGLPIQAYDAGIEGTDVPTMLSRPTDMLQIVKHSDQWLVDLEDEEVGDLCSVNYFVDIVSMYALARNARRVDFSSLVD